MVSVYGNWVDSNGNKYKKPYTCTFMFGILGNLLYFLAIVLPKGMYLVCLISVLVLILYTYVFDYNRTLGTEYHDGW